VTLNPKLASRPKRLIARLIDMVVGFVAAAIATQIVMLLTTHESLIRIPAFMFLAYLLFADSVPFLKGQSFGKKLMKIQVVDMYFHIPITGSYWRSFVRQILLLVPLIGGLDALCILGKESRRLGDWLAKTIVIDVNDRFAGLL
jgi:uncharacterized RDD family membrane protein YckC